MNEAVVDILGDIFGPERKHNDAKGQIAFDCPACAADKGIVGGDGKGNLEINYERGYFKCWACAETNNMKGVLPFLVKRYGTVKEYKDFKLFAPDYQYNSSNHSEDDEEDVIVTQYLPKDFIPLSEIVKYDIEYNRAVKYLIRRRIDMNIIKKFNIGYAKEGKYKGRVIIPSYDESGLLNYFVTRTYGNQTPKYLNPDTDKQTIIFNEKFINWDATIYLVEGPFDHIILPNSIPLLGKYMYDLLLGLITANAKGYIVIVLDGDAEQDVKLLYKLLNAGDLRGKIKVVTLPEDLDISEIYQKYGNKGLVTYLETAEEISESNL